MAERIIPFFVQTPTCGESCNGRIYYNPINDSYLPSPEFGYKGKCVTTKAGVDPVTGTVIFANCKGETDPDSCLNKPKKTPSGISSSNVG